MHKIKGMTQEEGLALMFQYAENKKPLHRWYDRTVAYAELVTTLTTGEDMERLMRQFVMRESKELFEQRKVITQHIIKCVVKRIMDIVRKAPNSSYNVTINFDDNEGDNEREYELQSILDKFWGNKTLIDYVKQRILELNFIDPNSFVVVEFAPFDSTKERVQTYPFEVTAKEAVGYEYRNNILQYLLVENKKKKGDEILSTLTMYLPNETIQLQELTGDDGKRIQIFKDGLLTEFEGLQYVRFASKTYLALFPVPHNSEVVPAFVAGYTPDLYTGGETKLTPFDAAIPLLMKSIKANSELDLTSALAAFPLSIGYVDACDNQGCHAGFLPDGAQCTSCKGTGEKMQTSVQERITFRRPKDPSQMFDLDKMLVWKSPPVEILVWMDTYINSLERRALNAVFNSEIFSRQEIAVTATEKNIDLQNVWDTLATFSTHIETTWNFFADITARFGDFIKAPDFDGLTAYLEFKREFKLKTTQDYIEELGLAVSSGAGVSAIKAIQGGLMKSLVNEDEYVKYETVQRHNPFSGLSKEEIALALASNFTTKENKVLYLNLGHIMEMLEIEVELFYEKTFEEQHELILAKVKVIIAEIGEVEIPALNFN